MRTPALGSKYESRQPLRDDTRSRNGLRYSLTDRVTMLAFGRPPYGKLWLHGAERRPQLWIGYSTQIPLSGFFLQPERTTTMHAMFLGKASKFLALPAATFESASRDLNLEHAREFVLTVCELSLICAFAQYHTAASENELFHIPNSHTV